MSTPTIPLPNGHASTSTTSPHLPPPQISHIIISPHHRSPQVSSPRPDIHAIKQEMHDALGENGLPYWKALNGYLLGQVGRGELEGMVRGWLKGSKVRLHNSLLLTLLANSSASSGHPLSPLTLRKRKRVGPEDPLFDIDETYIEPKVRVQNWMMGINGKERARMRRAVIGRQGQLAAEADGEGEDDGDGGWGETKTKKWTVLPSTTMPPLAATGRVLPSSQQLRNRLSQLSKAYDLNISPEALSDIGEFLAVGMDAHLSDIFQALIHFVGRDRPGLNTIHVPKGTNPVDGEMDLDGSVNVNGTVNIKVEDETLKPNLEALRDLFTLNPTLHASTSPALYKLASNMTLAEAAQNAPPIKTERKPSIGHEGKPILPDRLDRPENKSLHLVEGGLVKLDNVKKGDGDGEGGGSGSKKERKHNLHWKYEDPALILKSVLG